MTCRLSLGLIAACTLLAGCQVSHESNSASTARPTVANSPTSSPGTPSLSDAHPEVTPTGAAGNKSASANLAASASASSTADGWTVSGGNGAQMQTGDHVKKITVESGGGMTITRDGGGTLLHFSPDSSIARNSSVSVENGVVIVDGKVISSSTSSATYSTNLAATVSDTSVHAVKVQSDYGAIRFVRATVPGQISVESEVAFSGSAIPTGEKRKFLAGFRLALENTDGVLNIEIVPPPNFPKNRGVQAEYHIAIPEGLSINAKSINGAIEVKETGGGGNIAVESGYGSITIQNAGESIDATTDNGTISITSGGQLTTVNAHSAYGAIGCHGPATSVHVSSSNGQITVNGAANAETVSAKSDYGSVHISNCGGSVNASSSNGEVTYTADSAAPKTVDCRSDYGTVKMALGSCGSLQSADASSSNGTVKLQVAASASVHVHARTSNGSIERGPFSGEVEGSSYEKSFDGTLNGDRASIHVSSDYGSIVLSAE